MSEEESEGSLKDFIDNSTESEMSTSVETSDDSDHDDVLSVHSDESIKKKKKAKRLAAKAASSSNATTSKAGSSKAASTSSGPATRRTRANAEQCKCCATCFN